MLGLLIRVRSSSMAEEFTLEQVLGGQVADSCHRVQTPCVKKCDVNITSFLTRDVKHRGATLLRRAIVAMTSDTQTNIKFRIYQREEE